MRGACLLALLLWGTAAAAQEARPSTVAIDTTAEADVAVDADGNDTRAAIFDAVISAGIGSHFEAIVRPFVQRLSTGEWNRQIWVAALRYQRTGPVSLRIDGGLIPSPVGLSNLMLRPNLNPTIALPASLFTPLPPAELRAPRTTLLGAVYAYGVTGTVSTQRWDARVAVMDTSPLRTRRIFAETNPPRFTNVVLGGGVTPFVGLRAGASVTTGGWQRAGESPTITEDRDATIVTLESEYSVRYTKLSAEWVRAVMDSGAGDLTPAGWYVQGQQVITPRVFAAGRVERIGADALVLNSPTLVRQHLTGFEEVVGFRITPEITVRAGHRARQTYGRTTFIHAAEVSIVWWKRWI
jgi:hypothetical protein